VKNSVVSQNNSAIKVDPGHDAVKQNKLFFANVSSHFNKQLVKPGSGNKSALT
jgi:hypothetical protein